MNVRLLEIAQRELDEAFEHYNGEEPGLGDAFYGRDGADVVIVAVAHTRRRPGYWRDRIL